MIDLTAVATKTWYRPGLLFKAKPRSLGHQEICRSYKAQFAVDGTVVNEFRELVAEFASHGGEFTYTNPDGEEDKAATITLGFFDLDLQATTKAWDEEEREVVARHMLRRAEKGDENFELYTAAPAPRPWPKYDEAHHNTVAQLADQFGCLDGALTYEKENKNRQSVVAQLEEKLAASQAQAEELTAD